MNATYQHPIATESELVISYPSSGVNEGYATLHAQGCSHALRAVTRESIPFGSAENYGADDYFRVAPCARAGKAKVA